MPETKNVQKEPKKFESAAPKSKPNTFSNDKSGSSQDKIGRVKIDDDYEPNKEGQIELNLEDSD